MDKEKLLTAIKNSKEPRDEREKSVKLSSYIKGYSGGNIAIMLIILIRAFASDSFLSDIGMIIAGQGIFMSYHLYNKGLNKKLNLTMIVIMSLLFAIFVYRMIIHYEYI